MKTKTAKVLPKTAGEIQNGGLYLQRVRCGKTSCKCASGELHSAHYFFTRHDGKLIKFYVRKSELESFAALANQAAEERKVACQITKADQQLLKEFRQTLRERTLIINSLNEG